MIAAVQRMYFPVEQDVKTGSIDVCVTPGGRCRPPSDSFYCSPTGQNQRDAGRRPRGRSDRAQDRLRAHRAEQLLQRVLHVGLPGQSGAQLQAQARVAGVRPDRLEANREEEVRGGQAATRGPQTCRRQSSSSLGVAEGLDRLDAALGQIAGDALDQHPARATARSERRRPRARSSARRGVGGDRRGRKRHRARARTPAARTSRTRRASRRRRSSFPQEPHSSSVCETHASFSSPGSPAAHARCAETGSSSQKTQLPARPRNVLQSV